MSIDSASGTRENANAFLWELLTRRNSETSGFKRRTPAFEPLLTVRRLQPESGWNLWNTDAVFRNPSQVCRELPQLVTVGLNVAAGRPSHWKVGARYQFQ